MKIKLMKIASFAMVLGMVLVLATGCVTATTSTPAAQAAAPKSTEAAPQVVKIGFLTPLTGPSAALGQQVLKAANMIVDLINTPHPDIVSHMFLGGGVGLPNLNGAKIELVVADHKSDPAVAVAEAKRLITEEHVVAITGEFTSALIKAVAVVTEQNEIPFLAAGSAVTLTDGSTPLNWFFRFGVNDSTYIKDTFDFMTMLNTQQNAGIKTVALVSEDSEFGSNIITQETKYAALGGFTVVANIKYSSNATNLTSEVLKVKQANPDVLIEASAVVSDGLLFLKTCKEQNYTPKLIIGQRGAFIQPDFQKAMGTDLNYILTTGSWSADIPNPVAQELVKLYPAKYSDGAALSDAHVKDIACLHLLAMGINQAGTTESHAVRDALRNLQYDKSTLFVSWKGLTLDKYGQNTQTNGIVAMWTDGKYKVVYPPEAATTKAVYPMPAWSK